MRCRLNSLAFLVVYLLGNKTAARLSGSDKLNPFTDAELVLLPESAQLTFAAILKRCRKIRKVNAISKKQLLRR